MKFFVALTIALVLSAGAQAGFLDSIKDAFKGVTSTLSNVFHSVTPLLNQAATSLLGTLKATGSQLLATGAKALLGGLQPKTRDVAILDKIGQFLTKGDGVLNKITETIGGLFNGALSKLTGIVADIGNMNVLGKPLGSLLANIDEVVSSHNLLQSSVLKQMMEKPEEMLIDAAQHLLGGLAHHKRSGILDTLSSIGSTLANTFQPFISTVTKHISNIGATLKNVGSALFGALGSKLSTHISTLKQVGSKLAEHGRNAISALTDAVTDILGQTFKNAQPTIQNAIETVKDAGNVALNHFSGN